MKLARESSPFNLFTNPSVINQFIFGNRVVIYNICPTQTKITGTILDLFIIISL